MTDPLPQEVSSAVIVRESQAISRPLAIDEILAQVKLIQDVMHKVMSEGEHYGKIPGCGDKKTLLLSGAQKLTMTFRLAPDYQIQEVNLERQHKEYRIVCTLKSPSGAFVGQGVGCCSTMEGKYRWRGGARKCPECGKEAIIKGKEQYGGGWLCFGKKGGCGAKWPDGDEAIEGQSIERVENDNPADCYNTVLKIAKKRAFVDATITATAASDIFTQDIGDDESLNSTEEYIPVDAETTQDKPRATVPPKNTTPPVKMPPSAKSTPKSPHYSVDKARMKALNLLGADPGNHHRGLVTDFLRHRHWIGPNDEPETWPEQHLPKSPEDMNQLVVELQEWEAEVRSAPQ